VELTFRCPITLRSWSASPQESVAVSTLIDRRLGVAGSLSIETASKGGSSRSNYDPEHNRRADCRAAIIPSARSSGCRGTRTAQRCRPRQCLHCLLGCLDLQERSDCGNISQRFLRIAMQLGSVGADLGRQAGKTINQVCLIHGAAKQLHRQLFVRKNRPDPRQPLFCLAACVVEQDRVHARKRRSLAGFLAS
jgi:hypothetical protein